MQAAAGYVIFSLMDPPSQTPAIRHVPMEEIVIYHVSEDELDAIADGGADSVVLVFGIFLLSVAASFGANALLVEKYKSETRFTIFVVILVVSLIAGLLLLAIWAKLPNKRKKIIEKIRKRQSSPPEGVQLGTANKGEGTRT